MTASLVRGIQTTPNDIPLITPDLAGTWLAGSSSRTADALNSDTLGLALHYGWQPEDREYVLKFMDIEATEWLEVDSLAVDDLSSLADEAVDYLSELAPMGYYFIFDDGLIMHSLYSCTHCGEDVHRDKRDHWVTYTDDVCNADTAEFPWCHEGIENY
jgi:hypothetical protein